MTGPAKPQPDLAAAAAQAPARAGRRSAARLGAVQALYQIGLTGASPELVIEEFLEHRLEEELHDLGLDDADRALLDQLVRGVSAESENLDDILSAVLAEDWPIERLELLLRVILRAGTYELAFTAEIPARVAITEYLWLAQAFFDGKEPGMANGVLDRLARSLRPDEFEDQGSPRSEPVAG